MLRFYGPQLPQPLSGLNVGAKCPHCGTDARLSLYQGLNGSQMRARGISRLVITYTCDACQGPVPVMYDVKQWNGDVPVVTNARLVMREVETYNLDFVPDAVAANVLEALNCLSVDALNGFAAMCRRTVQSICDNLGAGSSTKVQEQIEEMITMTGLGGEWEDLAKQIMVADLDGSPPRLPEVTRERAAVLLTLLQDLTYELYTRPGKVRDAAQSRTATRKSKG